MAKKTTKKKKSRLLTDKEILSWQSQWNDDLLTRHFEVLRGDIPAEACRIYSLMFDVAIEEGSPISDLFAVACQAAAIRALEKAGLDWMKCL